MTAEEIAALEERFNLDEPVPMQYLAWLAGVARGELGWSAVAASPVVDVFRSRIPASFELGAAAALWAVTLGIGLGTFAARRRNRMPDQLTSVFAVGGASMPTFWLGIVLLIIFWSYLGWFPHGRSDFRIWASIPHPTGFYVIDSILAGSWAGLKDAVWHLVLPALTLGYGVGWDRDQNDALLASGGDGKGLRRRGPGPRSPRATRHPPSRPPQRLHPHDHRDRTLHRDHVRGHRRRGDHLWLARPGQLDGRFGAQR